MPAYSTSLPRMRGIGNFPPSRKSVTSPLDLTDVLLQMVPPCSARRQTITRSSQTARGCKIPDPKIPVIREGKELMCPFFLLSFSATKSRCCKKESSILCFLAGCSNVLHSLVLYSLLALASSAVTLNADGGQEVICH